MHYYLRKAQPGEENLIYNMVEDRVKWMDDNGIHQWNDTDYLEVYPLEYYKSNLDRMYVLAEDGTDQILCAAILFRSDIRWNSDEPAFYIHNLVSSINIHGTGKLFIELADELACKEGMSYLRLDSADDNTKLAAYYESLGFEPCGVCTDGAYHGILRQKKVKMH